MPQATAAGTVAEALQGSVDALRAAGADSPRLDAELLLAEAMDEGRVALAARPEAPVSGAAARVFGAFVRRRIQREPVAYILGRKGFRHIELAVDRRVLVPRPETELLVEFAVEAGPGSVLDIGTGSGAVALAIVDELPACEVTATDTSQAALEVARKNAARLGLEGRVAYEGGSVPPGRDFDLTVANLPYVTDGDWPGLAPEIVKWEPRSALTAGPDGLDAFREVIPQLRSPVVALEIGEGQAPAITALFAEHGYEVSEVRPDLAGVDRVVVASVNGSCRHGDNKRSPDGHIAGDDSSGAGTAAR